MSSDTAISPSYAVIDTAMSGDKLYAIPFTHNTFFMYYDKSLLSEDQIKSMEGIAPARSRANVFLFIEDSSFSFQAHFSPQSFETFENPGSAPRICNRPNDVSKSFANDESSTPGSIF